MSFFLAVDSITGHRSGRSTRAHDRHSHIVMRALEARNEVAMQSMGGGSAAPAPRRPRTQRAARKPAKSGDDDGGSEPARRHAPIFYELRDVADVLTLSQSGIQAMVRAGGFPKPRALGPRRVGWLVSEVTEWAISRPIADRLPPVNAGMRGAAA
ncbi:hypothetical protein R75465_02213 [Paraburkholderia aspalathi]|uniref:helix-turn-helix transcriptional regulator n=1 Tax=Paraburkholderia aspalathi TaxID=1324617 RepID=UPI001B0CC6C2|nr:AlpA family phage regulatory protein [Paraburkholderia aspalathi]CAE6739759.1 hypothetical protein R75465_02213 [Paraburkholderia aspalathi]